MDKELRDKIIKIVNNHDPVHLIEIGAPMDEYFGEISSIQVLLAQYPNITEVEIEGALKKLFSEKFSPTLVAKNSAIYELMAHDLFLAQNASYRNDNMGNVN